MLSRKKNESIVIGGLDSGLPEIRVMVVDVVGGHKVRLGIDAPREVPIVRQELVSRDAQRSAQTESDAVAGGTGETTLA